MPDDTLKAVAREEWERDIAWYQEGERDHDFLCHLVDELISQIAKLAAAVEERDEVLTVAYRVALQDHWHDLRDFLKPWSTDFATRERKEP